MIKQRDGFNGARQVSLPKMIRDLLIADPVTSALYITDIGYYPKATHHYCKRTVPIDQYIFIYCVGGRGSYTVDNLTYKVTENQYFIIPPGKTHLYAADQHYPWTIYWIHFGGKIASYITPDTKGPQEITPSLNSRIDNRNSLFDTILDTLSAGLSTENLRYAMSALHLYLGSLRYISHYRALHEPSKDHDIVDVTIHYMKENIERRITLTELANCSGYSISRLSVLFKSHTGHSPLDYCNLLKVQRACVLLDESQMKLNQICYKIGFDDQYYFSRFFRKIMGVSPREYRCRQRT